MKTIKVNRIKRRLFSTKRNSTLINAVLGILAAIVICAFYGAVSYIDNTPIATEVNSYE